MPTIVISDNTTADFNGSEDTQIRESDPTGNYSSETRIEAQRYSAGAYRSTLIKFSGLSNIPAGSTINSATLSIYIVESSASDASYQIGAYRLLRNWVEAEATWNSYSTGNDWATPGATGSGDCSASAGGTVVVGTSATTYQDITGLAADVQAMIDGANYGWLLRKDGGGTNDLSYRSFSSELDSNGQRPKLTVDYTASTDNKSIWVPYAGLTRPLLIR